MSTNAFTPQGLTVSITAAATAPTPTQCSGTVIGSIQYRIVNTGSVPAYLGIGANATTATANAVKPTGTATYAIPLLPSTAEVLTFNANAYFTAVTDSGTAVIFITPGDGM